MPRQRSAMSNAAAISVLPAESGLLSRETEMGERPGMVQPRDRDVVRC